MDYFLLLLVPFAPIVLFVACMLRAASAPTPPVPERKSAKFPPRPEYAGRQRTLVGSNA
jgi:hypothetical protein